jgi:hypothetical protein
MRFTAFFFKLWFCKFCCKMYFDPFSKLKTGYTQQIFRKLKTTSRYNFLSKITRSDSLEVIDDLYFIFKISKFQISNFFLFMSVRVNFAFEKSEICIENSVILKTTSRYNFLSKITRSDIPYSTLIH